MRTSAILAAVLALAVGNAFADRCVDWSHDLGPVEGGTGLGVETYMGQDATGWAVVMYTDGGDGTMSGFAHGNGSRTVSLGDDIIATDKEGTPITTAVQAMYGAASQYLFFYGNARLMEEQSVFTVVFNNTDMHAATSYLIVDDFLFTVPNGSLVDPPLHYVAGSAYASEWVSPEPSGMALMVVGLLALGARRMQTRRSTRTRFR